MYTSYLFNITQCVNIHSSVSKGSIVKMSLEDQLWPIFLVYANDLHYMVQKIILSKERPNFKFNSLKIPNISSVLNMNDMLLDFLTAQYSWKLQLNIKYSSY